MAFPGRARTHILKDSLVQAPLACESIAAMPDVIDRVARLTSRQQMRNVRRRAMQRLHAVKATNLDNSQAGTKLTGTRVGRYAPATVNFSFRQILSSIRSWPLRINGDGRTRPSTGEPRVSGRNFGARGPSVSPRSLLAKPQPGGRSHPMRRKIATSSIIPLLFLFTLGGCLGPDYLVTSIGPSGPEEAVNLRERELHYTDHSAAAAKPEIVRLAIDEQFTMYERAKILRAVNEWNHVLNGFVRLDINPATGKEPVWLIVPTRGGRPPPVNGMIAGHALAATQAVQPIGGVVIVYVDRVRGYDL